MLSTYLPARSSSWQVGAGFPDLASCDCLRHAEISSSRNLSDRMFLVVPSLCSPL